MSDKITLDTYARVADEFDKTRQYQWKQVKEFVENIPTNTLNLDIGCGNGRNTSNTSAAFLSTDIVEEMCFICKNSNKEIVRHCATRLPFKNHIFDHILCIAVLHHIDCKYQMNVLKEMKRVLRINGTAIIQVWAEGEKRHLGYNNIPWKGINNTGNRLYYIFGKQEFETLILSEGFQILSSYEEHENWGVIISPLST